MIVVSGEPPNAGCQAYIDSDYVGSEELQSCSSTDEDEFIPSKPKYSEFHEECDM